PSLWTHWSSSASCTRCELSGHTFAGIFNQGETTLSESTIGTTSSDPNMGGGVGIYGGIDEDEDEDVSDLRDADLRLFVTEAVVEPQPLAAVYLFNVLEAVIEGSTLSGGTGLPTVGTEWAHGDLVFAVDGGGTWDEEAETGILIQDNVLQNANGAALFLDGTSATIENNEWLDNSIDVLQQSCTDQELPEGLEEAGIETTELCPSYDHTHQTLRAGWFPTVSEAEN
ncbi:MAG: hypothetical protein QGG40_15165, partial [Myxococcota bacterium]|nr:hypothetical protein [Myxococcota bacterium]